ncbi:unnamed protein product [Toxocara canis]|nr:unnamed protein product [Toxocara canis]
MYEIYGFSSSSRQKSLSQADSGAIDDPTIRVMKKSAASVKSLPHYEDVCGIVIQNQFSPVVAFEKNGSLVEVQQDSHRNFFMTSVECEKQTNHECHGIDNSMYSSECVTVYEYRRAYVRAVGAKTNFVDGFIKVPVTCQCRLRRKGVRMLVNT